MQADKDGIALCVGDSAAVVKRRVRLTCACQHNGKSFRAQRARDGLREFQDDVSFRDACGPARAGIFASMSRIEHDGA